MHHLEGFESELVSSSPRSTSSPNTLFNKYYASTPASNIQGSKPSKASIWQHFHLQEDPRVAGCLLCGRKISRGYSIVHLINACMLHHKKSVSPSQLWLVNWQRLVKWILCQLSLRTPDLGSRQPQPTSFTPPKEQRKFKNLCIARLKQEERVWACCGGEAPSPAPFFPHLNREEYESCKGTGTSCSCSY